MQKKLAGTCWEQGIPIEYYITEDGTDGMTRYGLFVTYGEESCIVPRISISREKVMDMLDGLMQKAVTPCGVKEVLGTMLSPL